MSILGQFQFRRDTAAAWTQANPILLDGELGIESDSDLFKIGDGTTAWNDLPYGGIKGDKGDTGRAIVSVERTSGNGAAGTTDTYTITYSEAPLTSTFTVTNGANGISPTATVGTTTVVNPNVAPSVTDADPSGNLDLRFNLPRAATLSVAPTTTVNPATAPSVSRAINASGDATDTFSLPRAATLAVGATNTVTPITNPSVSRATNAAGDVTDTFNLPRARNVVAGTTTTGAAGTNAVVSSAQDANGDVTLNFTIPRGDKGDKGDTGQSVAVLDENTQLTATATSLNFVGGGVTATNSGNAVTVTIPADAVTSVFGRQGAVVAQQSDYDQFFTTPAEAAAAAPVQNFNGRTGNITPQQADYDQFFTTPSEAAAAAPVQSFNGRVGAITPQQSDYDAFFTTIAEASAAAPVQSVNGQTGDVTIAVPLTADAAPPAIGSTSQLGSVANMYAREDHTHAGVTSVSVNGGAATQGAVALTIPPAQLTALRSGLFTSTANSTAIQDVLTLNVPANYPLVGKHFSFLAFGTQSQSAAATNVVFIIAINDVAVATATVAGGTAAQTNRALVIEGMLQFTAVGAAGQVMGGLEQTITGIAANSQTNVAGVAVNTTAPMTLKIRCQTSTANAANIIRVAAASITER